MVARERLPGVDDRVAPHLVFQRQSPAGSSLPLSTDHKLREGLLGEKRWENLPEGGSRLWPQLYVGGGECQGRRMATDGNVAQSGAFPGSSEHLMVWMVGNMKMADPIPGQWLLTYSISSLLI